MSSPTRDQENPFRDHIMTKNPHSNSWSFPKTMICFIVLVSLPYIFYSLILLYSSDTSLIRIHRPFSRNNVLLPSFVSSKNPESQEKTSLKHIVFGIGASSSTWEHRRNYIKTWWRPNVTRGYVWLDKPVKNSSIDHLLPPLKVSSDTSKFRYTHQIGSRDAIRISRIVSENFRLGLEDVRWFVMGDDDTVFFLDNVVRVLSKYDYNEYYYIGYPSESHLQNLAFYYGMGYGGGGFAISYALAKALEKMQDECLHRNPSLYGSDERIFACMMELGVPLTKEPGFHQLDIYGDVLGILAAHPVAPLLSLHHLDLIEPIFPKMDRVKAVQRLMVPMKLDSAALTQQSICYDKTRGWTVSVSWGYAVQIYRGVIPAKDVSVPARTFIDWNFGEEDVYFSFNTRPVSMESCQKPFVYYLSNALFNLSLNQTASEYIRYQHHQDSKSDCNWKIADPSRVNRIEVYKIPDPHLWEKPPRRNCCRILPTKKKKKGTMVIDVGVCREGEIAGL